MKDTILHQLPDFVEGYSQIAGGLFHRQAHLVFKLDTRECLILAHNGLLLFRRLVFGPVTLILAERVNYIKER